MYTQDVTCPSVATESCVYLNSRSLIPAVFKAGYFGVMRSTLVLRLSGRGRGRGRGREGPEDKELQG